MSDSAVYRRHAAHCRELAAKAEWAHRREQLEEIARAWDEVADRHEAAQQRRMAS